MTRISTTSYENLREALSVVTWYKKSFERLVKGLLRSQPELLARLSFSGTKRETANMVVDILMSDERRYSDLTLEIMGELASMERFPDRPPGGQGPPEETERSRTGSDQPESFTEEGVICQR